jgi:hypothetical protein
MAQVVAGIRSCRRDREETEVREVVEISLAEFTGERIQSEMKSGSTLVTGPARRRSDTVALPRASSCICRFYRISHHWSSNRSFIYNPVEGLSCVCKIVSLVLERYLCLAFSHSI